MTTPFPIIPVGATPFVVSDAFSLTLTGAGVQVHSPGVFNTDALFGHDYFIDAYLTGGLIGAVPIRNGSSNSSFASGGLAIDIQITMYDLSDGSDIGDFHYVSPYGGAHGPIMNATLKDGMLYGGGPYPYSPDAPLVVRNQTPHDHVGPFGVGARFTIHNGMGPMTLQYGYCMQGALFGTPV